jgi:hypothetical protein
MVVGLPLTPGGHIMAVERRSLTFTGQPSFSPTELAAFLDARDLENVSLRKELAKTKEKVEALERQIADQSRRMRGQPPKE